MTKEQRIISDFLLRVYLESDNDDLDKWIEFLCRENNDEELAKVIGGFYE